MKKKIKQFYYKCSDTEHNNASDFIDGTLFSDYLPIIQLGIQTAPGVKFCLNGAPADDSIVIGSTGIYELDLNDDAIITGLRFVKDEFIKYLGDPDPDKRSATMSYGDLIIDIVYEIEEDEEDD